MASLLELIALPVYLLSEGFKARWGESFGANSLGQFTFLAKDSRHAGASLLELIALPVYLLGEGFKARWGESFGANSLGSLPP